MLQLTPNMKNSLISKLFTIALCVSAVAIGFTLNTKSQSEVARPEISGFAFPEPSALTDLELIDHNNETVTEKQFGGNWTFVYVGYTFCPDACPLSLNTLSQMYANLEEQNAAADVTALLVSVDPQRDSPERLKEYVKYFDESFVGATGTEQNLASFAKQVSAVYSLPKDRSTKDYLVDHSSSIVLINPNAEVHAIFTPPQNAEQLAADYIKLRDFYETSQRG